MNVNPRSGSFGRVVPWDSLTPEQQQSGDWIKLVDPTLSVPPAPVQARKRTPFDDLEVLVFRPDFSKAAKDKLDAAFQRPVKK